MATKSHRAIITLLHTCYQSSAVGKHISNNLVMDSDSFDVDIDTYCSTSMSPSRNHFITLKSCEGIKVKGIGKSLVNSQGIGTIKFLITDDAGEQHSIYLPNSLYCPNLPLPLLSPQHWAQSAKDHHPMQDGTRCYAGRNPSL